MKKRDIRRFFNFCYLYILPISFFFLITTKATALQGTDQDLAKVSCSISADHQSLLQVFDLIQKQTSFNFVCIDATDFLQKIISIDAAKSNLKEVLQRLSQKAGFTYTALNGNKIIITPVKPAPTASGRPARIIRGHLTDSKNEKLPGVTIVVKGTNVGTTTNQEGDFSIKVNSGDVLVLTFMGFKSREVIVGDADFYKIVLEDDAKGLSEVVVTALGIKKEKAKLGYAVQEVNGEELAKAKEPTLVSSLTGHVAGLTIYNTTDLYQSPTISLRGKQPLIVIDGIPDQKADFYKINSDDVENISVLKGAAASALYGSIGLNGAIMVTTKRGKGKSLSVELNSSTEVQTSFIRIPHVQTTYGDGYMGKYAYVDGSGGGTEGSGWIWGPKLDQKDLSTPSGYYETPQYNSPIDAKTGNLVPLPFISRGKNNVRDFFQNGVISSNNISITKAGDNGSFRISGSQLYQRGVDPNTNLNNSSFNVSGNYKLTDRLTVDAKLNYNRQYTNNYPVTGYGSTNVLYNLILWTGADVDVKDLRNYWVPGKEGVLQRNYNTSYYNNPYFLAYENLNGYDKDNTFGSAEFNYIISSDFSAKLRTGINAFAVNQTNKQPISYNWGNGNYSVNTENYFDIVTDLILDYNHAFGKDLKLHASVGGSNYYRNDKTGYASTDGLTIPGFYNLSNSTNPVTATNSLAERRTSSIYGYADLEYLNAYYLSITGRNDKISTLPVAHNSFFYPSVSGSVVLSELASLPSWLSFLKIRGSWSRVSSGQLFAGTYDYLPTYTKGTIWNNNPSLSYGSQLFTSGLLPQTSDSYETGFEAKLFKSRLTIDATYFQTRDYNNITNNPISNTSGFDSQLLNGNVYQRKGYELVLGATAVKTHDLRWNIGVNLSTYHNYLKEIYGGATYLNNLKAGDRADAIYGSVYQKDPNGNIIYDATGYPLRDPYNRFIGNADPTLVYGLQNTITYKAFSLRLLVDGRLGGKMYSATNEKMWYGGTAPGTVNAYRDDAYNGLATYVGKGVVVTGGQATYDTYGNIIKDTRTFAPNTKAVNYVNYMTSTNNYANTDYSYYSETFLKLREVTLTWNLPSKILARTFIHTANISLVGRNLLLFSKIPNVDPDSGSDNLQTPSSRTIGFNFNITF